jgi:hypothetical protein
MLLLLNPEGAKPGSRDEWEQEVAETAENPSIGLGHGVLAFYPRR